MVDQLFSSFSWQAIVLFSGLMTGFSHLVRKSQLARMGVFQAGFWKDLASFGLGLTLFFSDQVTLHTAGWWVVLAGLLSALGNGAYMSAMRGDLSGTATFGTSAGQLFILLGSMLFFGEWTYFQPTTFRGVINLISVILFFGGMWLYSGGKVGKWWHMMMISISTNVAVNLISKWVISYDVSAAENTVLLYIGSLAGDVVLLWWKRQTPWVGVYDALLGGFQGVLGGMAVYLYVKALEIAPLSLVSMTRRVAFMAFTIFVGMVWFGERKVTTHKKIVGLVFALLVFGLVAWVNK